MAKVKYGESRTATTTRIGDERWLVEHIDAERAKSVARKNGWSGGEDEGFLDYCDCGMAAATYSEHKTFDEALAAARADLATGRSLFGCAIIDRQRYEVFQGCPPTWDDQQSWEVDATGEYMEIHT